MSQEKPTRAQIEYYLDTKHIRYLHLLFVTKKYKDLYRSKEALLSVVLAATTTWVIYAIWRHSSEEGVSDAIYGILPTISAGLLGILGFLIAGQAIVSGTFNPRTLNEINKRGNFGSFMSILFMYYFGGSIVALTFFLSVVSSLLIKVNLPVIDPLFMGATFVVSYLLWFSLAYSTMLLGTTMRLILLGYHYVPPKAAKHSRTRYRYVRRHNKETE